jgi:alkanesulfonate monooxygenase SsuD/methylene tetrahydromethanopterin reductase-like flavin-dependent oxidoreductase (luciferase family)
VLGEAATMAEATAERSDWRALAAQRGRAPESLRYVARVMAILADTEAAARGRADELDQLAGGAAGTKVARFVGTPEQFAARLAEWHGSQACDGFDILPAVLPLDLDLLVDAVVPLLRRRGLVRTAYDTTTLRGHLGLQRSPSRFAA